MSRLFKSFLFKISKDMTFRITLIIGGGIALLMTALFVFLQYGLLTDESVEDTTGTLKFISGQGMLITALNPAQNFAIAVPITLVTFICLEFQQGAIRNKIIAGHSKFKIYISLYLSGLVYGFALIGAYVLICTGLGTIFGGFNFKDIVFTLTGGGIVTPTFLIKFLIIAIMVYTSIVSFAVFIATLFRNIGPCIPIVFVILTFLSTFAIIAEMVAAGDEAFEVFLNISRIVNPLSPLCYCGASTVTLEFEITNLTFIGSICSNLVYAGAFFAGGAAIFSRRDVK